MSEILIVTVDPFWYLQNFFIQVALCSLLLELERKSEINIYELVVTERTPCSTIQSGRNLSSLATEPPNLAIAVSQFSNFVLFIITPTFFLLRLGFRITRFESISY